jgi:hypothetical protein
MEERTMTGPSKEVIFANLDQKVQEYLSLCGNCAQTSFIALQEQFELEDGGAILKALTPFPGIALRGETCGTVVGSLMALGLVYGRGNLYAVRSGRIQKNNNCRLLDAWSGYFSIQWRSWRRRKWSYDNPC